MEQLATIETSFELINHKELLVHQKHELGEIFLDIETRNKYEILDNEGRQLAFAAERQKGVFGFLMRQYLGHWRKFDIYFFTASRQKIMEAHHPFRFFFQRFEVKDPNGKALGALQQRFSLLSKRFDVENEQGKVVMQISSPLWKPWTFPFLRNGSDVACIRKKFSGALSELFTDKDNFKVEYSSGKLTENERRVVLAASIFIDLLYFEKKN